MVPPDSHEISGVPCYSGTRTRVAVLRLRDFHPLRSDFPDCSTSTTIYHSSPARQNQQCGPTTPPTQHLPAITRERFSLIRFRSPLLSESLLFSLPVGTEMFHFPTFPPHALCVQAPVTGLYSSWVSPFGHPRITARLPTPRGLSQAPTSFIGSWCQGIHLVLLVACRHKDARVHCVVLNIRAVPCGERRLPALTASGSTLDTVRRRSCSCELDPSGPNSVPGRCGHSTSRFGPKTY